VTDGQEGRQYLAVGGPPIYSPDSQHLAFVADSGKGWNLILDDKSEGTYEAVKLGSLTFSPNSRRIAFAAQIGSKWTAVLDGKQGPQFDGIYETFSFSPDSSRLVYAARTGDKWSVVEDGKQGKLFDDIDATSVSFSPDSRHMAYVATVGGKKLVVADGVEQKAYDGIDEGQITQPMLGFYVKNNGHVSPFYASSGGNAIGRAISFSPDGRIMAYRGETASKWMTVVNVREGKPFDDFHGTTIVFDSKNELHYLAAQRSNDGIDVYEVEETIY
jgi:Tol biopolymer transport system component